METKSLLQHPMITQGTYNGLWGGYFVEIIFDNGNKSQKIEVNNGVRCMDCKCIVTVTNDGWIYVTD